MDDIEYAERFYQKIRDHVRDEDNLYNQRIIWLISMQAFLFATLGLILQGFITSEATKSSVLILGSFALIAVTGIVVALVSAQVIANGRAALNELRNQWDTFQAGLAEPLRGAFPHPRGRHERGERKSMLSRGFGSGNLPHMFVLIWIAYLVLLVIEVSA